MKQIKYRKDFDSELAAGERLVLFYSAWCPFCTAFMPAFERQADGGAGYARVCTDDLPELEDLFSIEVVPTVLFFSGGKLAARLDGQLGRGLTAEGLASFAKGRGKKP